MPWISRALEAEFLALSRDLREGRLVRRPPPAADSVAAAPDPSGSDERTLSLVKLEAVADEPVELSPRIRGALAEYTNGKRDYAATEAMARAAVEKKIAENAIIEAIMKGPQRAV